MCVAGVKVGPWEHLRGRSLGGSSCCYNFARRKTRSSSEWGVITMKLKRDAFKAKGLVLALAAVALFFTFQSPAQAGLVSVTFDTTCFSSLTRDAGVIVRVEDTGANPESVVQNLVNGTTTSFTITMRSGTHRVRYEFLPDSTSAQIIDSWVKIPNSNTTVCVPIYDVVFQRSPASSSYSAFNVAVVSSRQAGEALDLAKPANRNLGIGIVQISSSGTATKRMLAGCYTVFGYKGTCPGTTAQCTLSFADGPVCVGGDSGSTNTVVLEHPDG